MAKMMGMGGFMKKSRSAKGSFSGAKGKGMKGKSMMMGNSSFKTYKQSAPSTSSKLPKGARHNKK